MKMIALAGNPNAGKTTVFNGLTGTRQHVGNYPGVTVEIKKGVIKKTDFTLVDLPGIYSLTPYSEEERVARNMLWKENPDLIVNVVDSSNLERNLYLTLQLMEFGIPVVLNLNMQDLALAKGWKIDTKKLSQTMGLPVVETVGHQNKGFDELIKSVKVALGASQRVSQTAHFSDSVNRALDILEKKLSKEGASGASRWLALKLLEGDPDIEQEIANAEIKQTARELVTDLEKEYNKEIETLLAEQRYKYIEGVFLQCVSSKLSFKKPLSSKIDAIVLNKYAGIPIFLIMMYLVFQLTFTVGEPMMGWVESAFAWLGDLIASFWPEGSESLLKSLLVDGIIGGVGGVLVFLPNILLLFLAISILEDSGYMARAAFIMDRLMNKIGLHGKSFIPMLIGFGCSVPAIMATRTLDNRRDRLVTMLVVPLMSCGARLPIYTLIIPAFFPSKWHAPMLWLIYIIGILLAIISAKLMRVTIFKGETVPFMMELPPYHFPSLKGTLIHMWDRGKLYLQKAGTLILGLSILLWALSTFPMLSKERIEEYDAQRETIVQSELADSLQAIQLSALDNLQAEESVEYSAAGRLGKFIEPVIVPMGFDWRIGTSLVGAFAAKEVFVSTLGVVYSVGDADEESESLRSKLKKNYDPLIAFCIMLFSLISAPCMATIAVTKRESNSWKWAMFQLIGLTLLAYFITVAVYQIGRLAGL